MLFGYWQHRIDDGGLLCRLPSLKADKGAGDPSQNQWLKQSWLM